MSRATLIGYALAGLALAAVPATTLAQTANLSLAKTASPALATPGYELVFTLAVGNAGPDTATGVTVADALPESVAFVSASAGCTYDAPTHQVSCAVDDLPAADEVEVTITTTVDEASAPGPSEVAYVTTHIPFGVARVDLDTGAGSVVASGLPLAHPFGMTMDADGSLLVANGEGGVLRVDPVTGDAAMVPGTDVAAYAVDVAVDSAGHVWIADNQDVQIVRVDPATGEATTFSTMDLPASPPQDLLFEADGQLLWAGLGEIVRMDPTTGEFTILSSLDYLPGKRGLALEADGTIVTVSHLTGIIRVDPVTGTQTALGGQTGGETFTDIAVAANGDFLVTDEEPFNGGLRHYDSNATLLETLTSTSFGRLQGIAVSTVAPPTEVVNQATVTADQTDPDPTDNTATSTTPLSDLPPFIELTITENILVADQPTPRPPVAIKETIVFPWFLELIGSVQDTQGTFDNNLFITYAGDDDTDTFVDIYVYDQLTGQLLLGDANTVLCGPCSFPVGLEGFPGADPDELDVQDNLDPALALRMRTVNVGELISQRNGGSWLSGPAAVTGFIVVVVEGDDPERVHISGILVNAKSGPTDLFWLNLQQFRTGGGGGNVLDPLLEQIEGSIADLQDAVDQLPTGTELADEIEASLAVLQDALDQLPTRADLADEINAIAIHLDEQDALLDELRALVQQVLDALPGRGGGRSNGPGGP